MDRSKPTREIITQIYADMPDVPMYSGEEIVRCNDCKHLYLDADCGLACEYTNMGMREYDYCSSGERKGGDTE